MTLSFTTPGRFIPTLSLTVCLPPRSFLPLQVKLTGQPRLLYVRAERASLPSHASGMLAARLQAIGGTRTFTSQDSQHCRPAPYSLLVRLFHPLPHAGLSRRTVIAISRQLCHARDRVSHTIKGGWVGHRATGFT